ncbi:type II secretion system F family protein [Metallumcola ferriviriculae]|uniref:Type II secretion system F family protein n=1 Tax=Metallumcola ferriviriculae TaxID=3039180 RepID=A0AAU0UP91_9FIRM|nr:type II secretion system F family protein [Desulfitibacteraceae bacterium MK1]
MPHFKYKVRDRTGRMMTGTIEADTVGQVVGRLQDRNCFVIDINKKKVSNRQFSIKLPARRISSRDLSVFARQLATMINAGLPLLNALDICTKQLDNDKLRDVLSVVAEDLESGSSFAEALKKHDKLFPTLFINLIEVGEMGGVLDEVLEQLAVNYEREHDIREKVKSAMTYPAVVLIIALVAIIFLLTFVLPTFTAMLTDLGAELPLPTKIVIGTSNVLRRFWYLLPLLFIGLPLIFYNAIRQNPGKMYWHRLLLRVPVAGSLHKLTVISRFCRSLGTLVRGGVPVLQALEVVKKTAGNSVVEAGLSRAQDFIREGQGMVKPLKDTGVFPPMVIQMIQVGEETGTLDDLLERLSVFYDREVDEMVSRLSTIIEPILIVLLGGIVGFIIISIMLPMFSMVDAIG